MNTPNPFWGSTIIGVESRSDPVEFRQAVAETGKNWVCDIVGVFTALIKRSTRTSTSLLSF
jgi:hypothetical protein